VGILRQPPPPPITEVLTHQCQGDERFRGAVWGGPLAVTLSERPWVGGPM
jgi:hypothetical protein